ncbi:MAG TPA: CNNM domain-containing protein, partial [Burkholderiales bacterium]|nr:CNNM domain-containing protein [Burkholderiales bacterium]
MEALAVLALVLLNGVFAMSEVALLTARKSRLSQLAQDGDHLAAAALRLAADPTRFLSTIQIGITSV